MFDCETYQNRMHFKRAHPIAFNQPLSPATGACSPLLNNFDKYNFTQMRIFIEMLMI